MFGRGLMRKAISASHWCGLHGIFVVDKLICVLNKSTISPANFFKKGVSK
jgi:hypothetical protein